MKYQDLITQVLIFCASITSTLYTIFSSNEKQAIKRSLLVGKLIGAVLVAFFISPAIMEHFELTIKMTLLFTVILAYGLEAILKISVKKILKTIDKDGEDVTGK
jgi:FtsH-binding integral membrane protein